MSGAFLFDTLTPGLAGSGGGGMGLGGAGLVTGPGLLDPASPGQRLLELAAREEAAGALGLQQDAFLEAYQLCIDAEALRAAGGSSGGGEAARAMSPVQQRGAVPDQDQPPPRLVPAPKLEAAEQQHPAAAKGQPALTEHSPEQASLAQASLAVGGGVPLAGTRGPRQPQALLAQPLSSAAALGLLPAADPLRPGVAGMLLQSVAPSPDVTATDAALMAALRLSHREADAAARQRLLELTIWGGAHLRCPCGADVAGAGLPRLRCVCCGVLQHAACVSAPGGSALPRLGGMACSRTSGITDTGGCGTLSLGGGLQPLTASEAALLGAEELAVAAGQVRWGFLVCGGEFAVCGKACARAAQQAGRL
jgi:hypothetical protein